MEGVCDVTATRRKRFSQGSPRLVARMAGFAELGLSSWLVEQCRQLDLKQPTPVQQGCIPAILEGEWPSAFPKSHLCFFASFPISQPVPRQIPRGGAGAALGVWGTQVPEGFRACEWLVCTHTTGAIFETLPPREGFDEQLIDNAENLGEPALFYLDK